MRPQDAVATLRKVSALRALCVRLPHLPTPAEGQRLKRFDELVTSPEAATSGDVAALVAGWQRWWRDGNVEALRSMAARLPSGYVEYDRHLASLRLAAAVLHWTQIQEGIWSCTACSTHSRVELNVTQQTDPPSEFRRLLIISLAPPHMEVAAKTRAKSATNDASDVLRLFLEDTLRLRWDELTARGVELLHAVKCAIRPNDEGFQNPPPGVVDTCAPQHLACELAALNPPVVATLGKMAYRAVVRSLETIGGVSGDLKLSVWPTEANCDGNGYEVLLLKRPFRLFAGPFIRGRGRVDAARLVRRAARVAGIMAAGGARRGEKS